MVRCLNERNLTILKFIARSDVAIFIANLLYICLSVCALILLFIINLLIFKDGNTAGTCTVIEIVGSLFLIIMCVLIYRSVKYVRKEIKKYDDQKLELNILMEMDHATTNYGTIHV